MFDSGKVIAGLVIFLILATFPLWWNQFFGGEKAVPKPVLPANLSGQQCVLSAEDMRGSHMDILNEWRDRVVRNGERIYTNEDGREFVMSLQNTCLGCHTNYEEFCQKCHDYLGVKPYCWECHIIPKEGR